MVKIFIGNIPDGARSSELQPLFEKYGRVSECDILTNFGFVHMDDEEEAESAVKGLDGAFFAGATIKVELSHGKPSRGRGGGRGGRGGGGGRGSRSGGGGGYRDRDRRDRYDDYPPPRRSRDYYDRPDPYARDPYARDPYARDPYARDPYARDPYERRAPPRDFYERERRPIPRDPYSRDPFAARDPYARSVDPYARDRSPVRRSRPDRWSGYDVGSGYDMGRL